MACPLSDSLIKAGLEPLQPNEKVKRKPEKNTNSPISKKYISPMEVIKNLKRKSNDPYDGLSLEEQQTLLNQPQQRELLTPKKRIKWNLSHANTSASAASAATAASIMERYHSTTTSTPQSSSTQPAIANLPSSPARPLVYVQQQLGDLLQGIEKSEIIKIIVTLTSSDQELEDRITQLLPRPTLEITLGILEGLEKKLLEAIPYSRLGPDRSDYSYNRVRSQIDEIQGSLLQYLDFFTLPSSYPSTMQHEYPGESFAYLHATTTLVHRLPIWCNEERNREVKDPLYERLSRHWRITISEITRRVNQEGKVFGRYAVGEWAHNLVFHCNQVEGRYGFKEALDEFTRSLGWIIGVNELNQSSLSSQFVPLGMQAGL